MTRAEEVLSAATLQAIGDVGRADVVVGIPSYNNARTIGHVVRAALAGLLKYFPDLRCLVLNSDGGSADGTPDVVRSAAIGDGNLLLLSHSMFPAHRLSTPYRGIPGKGSAFRTIFRAAEVLGVRACAVVDADLRSITPEWIQLLVQPVLEHGFDYVAPYYLRHKFDGTITNSIVYPLTTALYGVRIRQPIGGDFGVSGRLVTHYLDKDVWDSDVARYGIDVWMTTTAICDGFRVCQSFLGAKIHDAKDPGADLSDMLVQVVGTVFSLMETHEANWQPVAESADTPMFGFRFGVGLEPVPVDPERMIGRMRAGLRDLNDVWEPILGVEDLGALRRLAGVEPEAFRFPDGLWVRTVYAFARAWHRRVMDRRQLVRSILPLYMGRVASWVIETWSSDAVDVDQRIERLRERFEGDKATLCQGWNGVEEGVRRGTRIWRVR
jgi:glucosylglycerate synthase